MGFQAYRLICANMDGKIYGWRGSLSAMGCSVLKNAKHTQ